MLRVEKDFFRNVEKMWENHRKKDLIRDSLWETALQMFFFHTEELLDLQITRNKMDRIKQISKNSSVG